MKKIDEVVLLVGFGLNLAVLSVIVFALAVIYLSPL